MWYALGDLFMLCLSLGVCGVGLFVGGLLVVIILGLVVGVRGVCLYGLVGLLFRLSCGLGICCALILWCGCGCIARLCIDW